MKTSNPPLTPRAAGTSRSKRNPETSLNTDENHVDHKLEKRRQRNRKAQRTFRLRRQAAHANHEKQLDQLEDTLKEIAGTFLGFTDEVLRSSSLRGDPGIINKLHAATDRILFLTKDHNGTQGSESPQTNVEISPDRGDPIDSSTFPPLPSHSGGDSSSSAALNNNSSEDHYLNTSNEPNRAGNDPGSSNVPSYDQMEWAEPVYNVFGDGLVNIPPLAAESGSASRNISACYLSQDALSVQIVRASIGGGYDALLKATDLTTARISKKFGFPLSFRSREEILMILRWYLRPGAPEVIKLAAADFDDCLLTQYIRQVWQSPHFIIENQDRLSMDSTRLGDRLKNAHQVEQWLLARGMKYIDADNIELSSHQFSGLTHSDEPATWSGSSSSVIQPSPQVFFDAEPILHARAIDGCIIDPINSPKTIRISKTKLVFLLADTSVCLERGPAYSRESLMRAVTAASVVA